MKNQNFLRLKNAHQSGTLLSFTRPRRRQFEPLQYSRAHSFDKSPFPRTILPDRLRAITNPTISLSRLVDASLEQTPIRGEEAWENQAVMLLWQHSRRPFVN